MIHNLRIISLTSDILSQQFLQANSNDKTVLNIYQTVASDVSNSGMVDEKIQTHFSWIWPPMNHIRLNDRFETFHELPSYQTSRITNIEVEAALTSCYVQPKKLNSCHNKAAPAWESHQLRGEASPKIASEACQAFVSASMHNTNVPRNVHISNLTDFHAHASDCKNKRIH